MNTYPLISQGSLLEVPGRFLGLYKHFGVYLGNGWVIHSMAERGIEIVTLDNFCDGRPLTVRESGVSDPLGFQARLQQAMSNPICYDLVIYNCEHFTAWLRTGESKSTQVQAVMAAALVGFGLSLVLTRAK